MEEERLQKYLARHGLASRRAAEKLIAEGRVEVDGLIIKEQGYKVKPGAAIFLDGLPVGGDVQLRYILLHKPAGYICTAKDEFDRPTVLDLIRDESVKERVYTVGRLDYDSGGLLLLTNDGTLTQLLLHPSHQVEKIYLAEVEGCPSQAALRHLQAAEVRSLCQVIKQGGDDHD